MCTVNEKKALLENQVEILESNRAFLRKKKAVLVNKRAIPGNKRVCLENKSAILEKERAVLVIKCYFWGVKGNIDVRMRALATSPLSGVVIFCSFKPN